MLDYIKNQVNLRMSVNPTKQTKTTEDIEKGENENGRKSNKDCKELYFRTS